MSVLVERDGVGSYWLVWLICPWRLRSSGITLGRGLPWSGCQSVRGLTQRDRQPFRLTANLGSQVDLMNLWHEAGLFHGEHTGLGRPCNIHTEPQSALIQTTAALPKPPKYKAIFKKITSKISYIWHTSILTLQSSLIILRNPHKRVLKFHFIDIWTITSIYALDEMTSKHRFR